MGERFLLSMMCAGYLLACGAAMAGASHAKPNDCGEPVDKAVYPISAAMLLGVTCSYGAQYRLLTRPERRLSS